MAKGIQLKQSILKDSKFRKNVKIEKGSLRIIHDSFGTIFASIVLLWNVVQVYIFALKGRVKRNSFKYGSCTYYVYWINDNEDVHVLVKMQFH